MTGRPLCIDLFCGLGGWTDGFLAEGWDVIGFDIERHEYHGARYPAQLVLQDVRTLDGSQFRNARCIVASSPCQEFSYRAMPWKRARALGAPLLGIELFQQAARVQAEASRAAGRRIPMVQENVRGAQPYVGRAAWRYGSFYLWGDVPAVMPFPLDAVKTGQRRRYDPAPGEGMKGPGGSWFGAYRADDESPTSIIRRQGSRSKRRKAATAQIAKIPFQLAQHIARVYYPTDQP